MHAPVRIFSTALLGAVLLLAGCGGGGAPAVEVTPDTQPVAPEPQPPAPGGPPPDPAAEARAMPRLAFQTGGGGLIISSVLPQDGSLRPLHRYLAADLGAVPQDAAADPLGRFVLLLLQGSWVAFGLDDAGRLVMPGLPAMPAGDSPPVFSLDGRFLYLAMSNHQVHAYSVGPDGRMSPVAGSPFGPAEGLTRSPRLVLDASGRLLYLQALFENAAPVRVFTIDPGTGAAQPVSRDPAVTALEGGRIAPAGPGRAWVRQADQRWVLYTVNVETGALAPAVPALGVGPVGGAFTFHGGVVADAGGRLLVVSSPVGGVNPAAYQLQLHVFDAERNTLTAVGAPVPVDIGRPWVDAAGRFRQANVVVEADPVSGLRVLANTSGGPEALLPAPAALPRAVTYALDADASLVRVLRVDPATGLLEPAAGGTAAVTGRPVALAMRPGLQVLAVAASSGGDAGTLAAFVVDRRSGLLATMASTATGAQPTAVAFSPAGSTVYVSHRDGIDAFAVDAVAGTLGRLAGTPWPTGFTEGSASNEGFPFSQTFPGEPVTDRPAADMVEAGAFLFLATNKADDGRVSTMTISGDRTLGPVRSGRTDCGHRPSPSSFSASGVGTVAVAAVPDGSLVYAANRGSNSVTGFRTNYDVCFEQPMPPVTGGPFATGQQPVALAADPSGAWLFAANAGGSGSVTVYAITPFHGRLVEIWGSPFPAGLVPARIWTDAMGRFVYTADAAGKVNVQAFDRVSGVLGVARAALPEAAAHTAIGVVLGVD